MRHTRLFPLILCAVISALTGCQPAGPVAPSQSFQQAWAHSPACTLRLVAYKKAKASVYYLEEVGSRQLFRMHSIGGRREPTIALGATLQSKCDYNQQGERITEFEAYRTSIVRHYSGRDQEITLPGYEYLTEHM